MGTSAARDHIRKACDLAGARQVPFVFTTVSFAIERVHGLHTQPTQRFRLPRANATPDPRESGEFGVTAEHEVGEGPTGKVGGGQPAAHVATCGAETSFQVELDGCAPVTGYAQDAAPGLSDWNVTGCGEHVVEQIGQSADRPVLGC